MNELLNNLEETTEKLNFTKSKLKYPLIYKPEDFESELLLLTEEENRLKEQAIQITNINDYKILIYSQLTEYVNRLDSNNIHPFSRNQGLSFPMFYISPLMDLKNIILSNFKGICLPVIYLTLNDEDAVKDKELFLNFLKEKRDHFYNATDLYNLYSIYNEFKQSIARDFCLAYN